MNKINYVLASVLSLCSHLIQPSPFAHPMSVSKDCFRVVNCWSKAGVGTCTVLEYKQSEGVKASGARIVLDLGSSSAFVDTIRASVILLSHGHVDHVGGMFSHARAHSMALNKAATYYVPAQLVPLIQNAKEAMMALDSAVLEGKSSSRPHGAILEMNIVGVNPGDVLELPIQPKFVGGHKVFLHVLEASHANVPALSYVIETRKQAPRKLLPEYQGKNGKEIQSLIRQGIDVKGPLGKVQSTLQVAYTGDTTIESLVNPKNQIIWQCNTILCEATMLEDSEKAKTLARDRGHLHVSDIVERIRSVDWEPHQQGLILIHISARYTALQSLDLLVKAIPNHFHSKVQVAIAALDQPWKVPKDINKSGLVKLSSYSSSQSNNKKVHKKNNQRRK